MDPLMFAEGSYERFNVRRRYFRNDKRPHPELRHAAFWVLHNCVAHPLLAATPGPLAAEFHELTSQWLQNRWPPHGPKRNLEGAVTQAALSYQEQGRGRKLFIRVLPDVPPEKRRAWVLHNLVAHLAIGLVPCKATFDFHDKTAEAMNVEGWV